MTYSPRHGSRLTDKTQSVHGFVRARRNRTMKKWLLIPLSVLLLHGCGRPLRELEPGSPPAPDRPGGFSLQHKFQIGQERRYLLRTAFSSHSLDESTETLSVSQEVELRQVVLDLFPGGGARVALLIEKLRFLLSRPGASDIVFDSEDAGNLANAPSGVSPPPMSADWPFLAGRQGLAFLVGKKIEIEQAPSGQIARIAGLAAMYRQALSELPLTERQPVERLLRDMSYKPRGLLGLSPVFLPRTVRVGERWWAEAGPFPIFCGRLVYPCQYALTDVSDGQAAVEFAGELGEPRTETPPVSSPALSTPEFSPETISQPAPQLQPFKSVRVRGDFSFDIESGVLTAMRGESSSFIAFGGSERLRTQIDWELALQPDAESQTDVEHGTPGDERKGY